MLVAQIGLDHRMRATARVFVVAEVEELAPVANDLLGFGTKRPAAIQAGDFSLSLGYARTSGPLELAADRAFRSAAQRGAFGAHETNHRRLWRGLQAFTHALRHLGRRRF